MNRIKGWTLYTACAAVGLMLVFACAVRRGAPALDPDAVALHNRGVALMGQFDFEGALAVFQDLHERYPGQSEILINEAIATLNRQWEGDERTALGILEGVLEREPGNRRALYCSGLLQLYMGNPETARGYFETIIEADPRDAEALYFLGKTQSQLSLHEEAAETFGRVIELDPYLLSSYYGLIMAYRQQGKRDEARTITEEYRRMQENPRCRLIEFKYTRMGEKAEVRAIDAPEPPARIPQGPVFGEARPLTQDAPPGGWSAESAPDGIRPHITIADCTGDGVPDISIAGVRGDEAALHNALLEGGAEPGSFRLMAAHPLAGIPGVRAVLWGDIDENGLLDAYLCRRGPDRMMLQTELGVWEDTAEDAGTDGGDQDTTDGLLFDADHDGDLDLLLVRGGGVDLLNNDRDGTFRSIGDRCGFGHSEEAVRAVLASDLDADGDVDLLLLGRAGSHRIFLNDRSWEYVPAAGFDAFRAADIEAALAGDADADGRPELYTLNGSARLSRWSPDQEGDWRETVLSDGAALGIGSPAPAALALADANGDGILDLFLSGDMGWTAVSLAGSEIAHLHRARQEAGGDFAARRVMHTDGGPAVVEWVPGSPPRIWPAGPGRFAFASLRAVGRVDPEGNWRTNASGIGTRVSARVGSRWTVFDTLRADTGPGQSLQPFAVGLGGASEIDFVALEWPDGVFQTELNLEAGRTHTVSETQRQTSSCPVLFAWDGARMSFVSDLIGVGGIGYAVGPPGEAAESRPWEDFLLPLDSLAPRNGKMEMVLTEPMEEASYIDSASLLAWDLPPGWKVTVDERMGIMGPQPTGEALFFREEMLPISARNGRGEDVIDAVSKRDLRAAPPGPIDHRFIGRLREDHVLTLTFPRATNAFDGRPVLVMDGWVEYPYSQTNFAAWQAEANYEAPSLDILEPDGRWRRVWEQFGYPAGMPRQMALPLPDLPAGTRTLRIVTNQEIYWDRIAVAFAEDCPEARRTDLPLRAARLERIGFPRRVDLPQRLPSYDFSRRDPLWDARVQEGWYTAFGEAEELVARSDGALAIFGPGEGLSMAFEAPQDDPSAGWTRRYVLNVRGWCKDMDPYTLGGETLAPVPRPEDMDARAEMLNRKYNTRFVSERANPE